MPNLKTTPEERAAARGRHAGAHENSLLLRALHDLDTLAAEVERLKEFLPLVERLAKGRAKYPSGCTLLSLIDEAGEVAHAVNKYESVERVREELLDVAAVAMRLYLGEIDRGLEMDGLVQRRRTSDQEPDATSPVGAGWME